MPPGRWITGEGIVKMEKVLNAAIKALTDQTPRNIYLK
jgi:hypothetical protein